MTSKRKGKEIEGSGSGAGKKQSTVRNHDIHFKMTSKGVCINLLSLNIFLLVDTLILMLWID